LQHLQLYRRADASNKHLLNQPIPFY